MSPAEQPPDQHQVGITNAQENNPDAVIADLTRQMNALFAAGQLGEAALFALDITARSKDELKDTFVRHGVRVLHLDHEAFGIYEGLIEPTYDVHVEGTTHAVLAAATEFGRCHAQEMILAVMNEMNDRAKAEGRYLGKAFWEIPPQPGSIHDAPSTPEARQRLAALRARRLQRRNKSDQQGEPVEPRQDAGVELHQDKMTEGLPATQGSPN